MTNDNTPTPFDWKRSMRAGLTFRPVTDDDMPFLARVYASTHKESLAATSLTDVQKTAILLLQFRAHHAHVQQHYPQADLLVVMGGGYDIGRLYLARWPARHGIIDLALLPEYRRHGAGEVVLRDLMDEAAAAGKDVSIHVEKDNPAMRLYRRLGFTTEEDEGVYDLMRWKPAGIAAAPPGPGP
jgi:ribosomal protein S18 acetylase RimI-like enzyme